ncbi:RagB/SusD family nutrient uptake outer membrane protein [Chitinophaga sp. LS1]|uniref:RagB/SusD family nutrient uptake outer membrane protein n=1 Tax=Chitinophaga sp. LS1 TaxID=3051176 RepID=UPI002AAB07B8|nr:RagB/SusD family nutrient uptake outer membrane protein [Chitinophaga sp. LS1]WPV67842.1 RagB/SusD family nutrient uptake outer membrane protein [Chitinophaga sp. LS1]
MRYLFIVMIVIIGSACNKILDAGQPTDKVTSVTVYESNTTAIAALNGIYSTMSSGGPVTGNKGLSFLCGLSADEFILQASDMNLQAVYQNALVAGDVDCWTDFYNYIYQANLALEGLEKSQSLKETVRKQLKGEALFVRAFSYFYLVNLYGDVPLLLNTDYKYNAVQPRTAALTVYAQIVNDLNNAVEVLSGDFLAGDVETVSSDRVRPGIWSAKALLARVYLYTGEYEKAVKAADTILKKKDLFDTVPLVNVFLKNSREAIWQLQPVKNNYTDEGYLFLVDTLAACSKSLLHAFEVGDKRQQNWVLNGYPFKYKSDLPVDNPLEYLMMIRVGELYLIRAESKAHLKDLNGALADLNIIRKRAGIKGLKANTQEQILSAIIQERRVELFSEWGHRWFDLKRSGNMDEVMKTKTSNWQAYQQLYPLMESELRANPYLKQNAGY